MKTFYDGEVESQIHSDSSVRSREKSFLFPNVHGLVKDTLKEIMSVAPRADRSCAEQKDSQVFTTKEAHP